MKGAPAFRGVMWHLTSRRAQISNSPVARFVKGLRNYSLHRELPWVGNSVTIGRDDQGDLNQARAEVQLSTGPLLAWDGWSPEAKHFIRESGDIINNRQVLAEHRSLVRDLYMWVAEQYNGLHRFEVAMYDELVDEYNWAISSCQEVRSRRFGPTGSGA